MRLRTKLLGAAAALVLVSATAAPPASATPAHITVSAVKAIAVPASFVATTAAIQDAKLEVKVDDNRGGAWYTQPVWIAIGIVALVLIILLIISAGRRDTTTVVK
jgi:DMSO/TMAO reductase YedYZ heme-binding membrane subunit